MATLDQGLFGDELSTAWIVHGRSLGTVISFVYSDKEVTPPLSFVLAWAFQHLGSSWLWLRVPSLLAGTATVPLVYGIGARTAGRTAGLLAAAICTLSGVMIMFSTEARTYAELMAALSASTLAMLLALDTGRRRWWVAYGAASCLAMYSHYSAAFVLIAQLGWLLFNHPSARRAAIFANCGAALFYLPWIPGWWRDLHAVTIPIINKLLPFTFTFVGHSVIEWAAGYPYATLHQVPGAPFVVAVGAGALLAAISALIRGRGRVLEPPTWGERIRAALASRIFLVLLLASATLVGELIYGLFGAHVLDSRDMNASWPALAVALGVLVAMAGPLLGALSCALLLAGYGASALASLKTRWQRPDYPAVARYIEQHARPGDSVVDGSIVPVVPLTGLDAYLPQTHAEFRLGLPEGPPPYTAASRVPKTSTLTAEAQTAAADGRIFLVLGGIPGGGEFGTGVTRIQRSYGVPQALSLLSRNRRIVASKQFTGIEILTVLTLGPPSSKVS